MLFKFLFQSSKFIGIEEINYAYIKPVTDFLTHSKPVAKAVNFLDAEEYLCYNHNGFAKGAHDNNDG